MSSIFHAGPYEAHKSSVQAYNEILDMVQFKVTQLTFRGRDHDQIIVPGGLPQFSPD